MDNTLWFLLIIGIVILSIRLMIKIKFDSFKISRYFFNYKFNNITSLCMFLGTKLGVGVFISVSISLLLGGPSTLIWMILFMFITSPIIHNEAFLGFKSRKKMNNVFIGGPNLYIKNKRISKIYLVLFLITYTLAFMMIQTNTLFNIIDININVNKTMMFTIFFIILTYLLIFDTKEILSILNKLVIFMCSLLIILFLIIIIKNIDKFKDLTSFILNDLNNKFSVLYALINSIILTVKRNVFQTELLLGTTSIGSASSSNLENAINNNMIGHYFLILIVFLTGIVIILYQMNNCYDNNYFMFITNVFRFHFGRIGVVILITLFILFALTTLISAFYFGIINISFYRPKLLNIYKIIMLMFSLCGIFINEGIIWWAVDLLSLILMVINGITLWRYSYDRQ